MCLCDSLIEMVISHVLLVPGSFLEEINVGDIIGSSFIVKDCPEIAFIKVLAI